MNRSSQIREIYAELRRALGGRINELEALEYAAAIVNLFVLEDEDEARFDLRVGGIPFDQWGIDTVFADGGWRLLEREPWLIRDIAEEEEYEQLMYQGFKRFNEERVTL